MTNNTDNHNTTTTTDNHNTTTTTDNNTDNHNTDNHNNNTNNNTDDHTDYHNNTTNSKKKKRKRDDHTDDHTDDHNNTDDHKKKKNRKKRKREEFWQQRHEIPLENKSLLKYFRDRKDPNLLNVVQVYDVRNDGVDVCYADTEGHLYTLDVWMLLKHPADENGVLDKSTFLDPLRSLLRNLLAIRGYYRDFSFEACNVLVIKPSDDEGEGVLKILLANRWSRSQQNPIRRDRQCINDLANIINKWLQIHESVICPDLKLFLYCLDNFGDFFGHDFDGGLQLLIKHPIFYPGDEKKALFDMSYKVHRMMLVEQSDTTNLLRIFVDAFELMEVEIDGDVDWFIAGIHQGIAAKRLEEPSCWHHPMSLFLAGRNPLEKLVRTIRNVGVHMEEKQLDRYNSIPFSECGEFLEKVLPGIFSVIHYVIIEKKLTACLIRGGHFW